MTALKTVDSILKAYFMSASLKKEVNYNHCQVQEDQC